MKHFIQALLLAAVGWAGVTAGPLEERVRRELVRMPYLTVFDHLEFGVDSRGNVILMGQVTRPTLKADAERLAKGVEGVAAVENRIEVLPLSNHDASIRLRVARAIYGAAALNRYALGTNPPIRIIVKNGHVTLKGYVGNEGDRRMASIRASGVSEVFGVKNELVVSKI